MLILDITTTLSPEESMGHMLNCKFVIYPFIKIDHDFQVGSEWQINMK